MSKYDFFNTNNYSVHQRIIQFVGQNKKVLDVGYSEGILSEVKQNNCEVVGIELDIEAAQKADSHCVEVINGNVEYNIFKHKI